MGLGLGLRLRLWLRLRLRLALALTLTLTLTLTLSRYLISSVTAIIHLSMGRIKTIVWDSGCNLCQVRVGVRARVRVRGRARVRATAAYSLARALALTLRLTCARAATTCSSACVTTPAWHARAAGGAAARWTAPTVTPTPPECVGPTARVARRRSTSLGWARTSMGRTCSG
jgi:hypothetical protein